MNLPTDAEMSLFKRLLMTSRPETFQALTSKKYHLPNHLVMDYMNQQDAAMDTMARLSAYLPKLLLDQQVQGPKMQTIALISWMYYGMKTLWLERDLGEILLKTVVLDDLSVQDLHFPWPCFKVMIPYGLARSESGRSITSVTLSIERTRLDYPLCVQNDFNAPKFSTLTDSDNHELTEPRLCVLYTTATGRDDENTGLYAMWEPLDKLSLSKSIAYIEAVEMPSGEMTGDKEIVIKAKHIAFNMLLYLSSIPAIATETKCLRKEKRIGKNHVRGAIYEPQWVGDKVFAQFKASHPVPHSHTGRKLPGHWRAGHWKRLPVGTHSARPLQKVIRGLDGIERILILIYPYRTHGNEDENAA